MKYCNKCKTRKQLSEFNTRGDKKGLESNCKSCKQLNKTKWYTKNKHQPNVRYKTAVSTAKSRKLDFSLSIESFTELISKECFYCQKDGVSNVGVGLDRIDNNIGYHLSNVVPCCGVCNLSRNNNFTSEEWLVMIRALKEYKTSRGVMETLGSSKPSDEGSNPSD